MELFIKVLFREIYHYIKDRQNREFLRLAFDYGDKPRYQPQNIKFLSYSVYVPDALSFLWQYKDIFAEENYKFNSDNHSPIIYDCGANIGMSCIYFRKIFPTARIKAFEANPEIAGILDRNLKQNGFTDIEVIPKAVWTDTNGIELSMDNADASSVYSKGNKIKVDSIRLKDILEAEKSIDMLKMDIEGAEANVIRDCDGSLGNVKNLFIEYHSYINYQQELGELLQVLTHNKFRYFIKHAADRDIPFINRTNKNFPDIDVQLNIYAYRQE